MQQLKNAINQDAYNWLSQHASLYVSAIDAALAAGRTPDEIQWYVQSQIGPDRQGLALRCKQAAEYMRQAAA